MCAVGKTIYKAMMVPKKITLLDQTAMFNNDIRECEQRRAVTTEGKGGYIAAVQNIFGVQTFPPEEHHKAINRITTIFKGIQTQTYDLEGLVQANAFLTSSNSSVMAQLAHMNVSDFFIGNNQPD